MKPGGGVIGAGLGEIALEPSAAGPSTPPPPFGWSPSPSLRAGEDNYLGPTGFRSVSDSLSNRAAQGESGWSSVSR